MKRFLVIANYLLGDGLDTFPALNLIFRHLPPSRNHSDERQYDLLTYRYTASLYKNIPFDRIFIFDQKLDYLDKNLPLIKKINHILHLLRTLKGRYHGVIIFPGGFGWGLWARLLHPQFIVGHGQDFRSLLLTHPVKYSRNQPNYESFLSLAEKFIFLFNPWAPTKKSNIEMGEIRRSLPSLIPCASSSEWEKKIYDTHKSLSRKSRQKKSPLKHYIVISPTASEQNKTWEGGRFCRLAEEMILRGYTVFWVGLGKEHQAIEKLAQNSKRGKGEVGYNLAGVLELEEVFALIKKSRGFIGNDSGLAHVAAMLGMPTVVIYGPANPTLSRPLTGLKGKQKPDSPSNLCQIFREHPDVSHPQRREKHFQKIFNINLVTIDEVLDEVREIFPKLKK